MTGFIWVLVAGYSSPAVIVAVFAYHGLFTGPPLPEWWDSVTTRTAYALGIGLCWLPILLTAAVGAALRDR